MRIQRYYKVFNRKKKLNKNERYNDITKNDIKRK